MKRDFSLRGPTTSQERSGKRNRPAPFEMTGGCGARDVPKALERKAGLRSEDVVMTVERRIQREKNEERFLSARADYFAGAKWEEKSARSVRNDGAGGFAGVDGAGEKRTGKNACATGNR